MDQNSPTVLIRDSDRTLDQRRLYPQCWAGAQLLVLKYADDCVFTRQINVYLYEDIYK